MMRAACLSLFVLPLLTAQDPVPLSHAVPRDMHFYVHGKATQTPDPGWVRFERGVRMLAESRIHEDVLELATMDMSPRERQEVLGVVSHMWGLLAKVDWSLLGEQEMVFAYRMLLPAPEYMAVFRVPDDRVGEQLGAMKEMLGGFAQMFGLPPESVREIERQSGTLTVLGVQGVPFQLAAGAVGDVLVMGTSQRLVSASMSLLEQGPGARSLGASDHFQEGLEKLPPATEDVLFVDVHGLMDFYRQAMRMGLVGASGRGEGARQSREILGVGLSLLDELDVFESLQMTTQCDGNTLTSTSRLRLVDDFQSTAMAAVVAKQQPWTNWHQRVPADATSFAFDTGCDLAALFDLTVEHMRESEFLSAVMVEHADAFAAVRSGLGHISGEVAWVSLPTAGHGPSEETVCFLRLSEPEAFGQMLPEWLGMAQGFLASRGQRMNVHEAGGLHEIELAAFPWFRPVIGVRGAELVFASSPGALRRIDRVQSGQAPSIRECAAFRALGIGQHEAAEALAYGRTAAGMGGFPDLLSGAGFFLSLLPEDRDTRPLLKVGAILTKLAPALREMDMGYDWGTEMVPGDDPDTCLIRTVYRYLEDR